MKAEYDSEADALSIDLIDADRWSGTIWVDDDYCHIALSEGKPANIELLSPGNHLDLLGEAAVRSGVEPELLEAAAQSALAAPDRTVSLSFSPALG